MRELKEKDKGNKGKGSEGGGSEEDKGKKKERGRI